MRTILAAVLSVVVILGLCAAPALAQPAAPKVTVNGLIDFVSSYYKNVRDSNITNDEDEGWYARERGRFEISGAIGKAKGVFGFEIDMTNGEGNASSGTSGNFDLDGDVAGVIEVRWLYLEAPVTGAGSLMPFLPMETLGRFGQQPARGHAYKPGILWSGDFPGVTLHTTWAPNLRSTLTYAQIDEALDELNAGADESYAFLASVEFDVFKGLTIKPTYAYANYDGVNDGSTNLGTESPKDGFTPARGNIQSRHYVGAEVRWRTGPFSLEPSLIGTFGKQECSVASCGHTSDVDIASFIFDVIGGFQTGPLLIEGRFAYTPGMKAEDCVQAGGFCGAGGEDIKYYRAINPGFIYQAGWAETQTSGVDYNLVHTPANGSRLGISPSYDKYGRMIVAGAVDYSVTPAFILHGVVHAMWTAEKVDTGRATVSGVATSSGDDDYLGTEANLGFTYRFAPNLTFDMIGAWLFTGDARGFNNQDPEDAYKVAARMRVTF